MMWDRSSHQSAARNIALRKLTGMHALTDVQFPLQGNQLLISEAPQCLVIDRPLFYDLTMRLDDE